MCERTRVLECVLDRLHAAVVERRLYLRRESLLRCRHGDAVGHASGHGEQRTGEAPVGELDRIQAMREISEPGDPRLEFRPDRLELFPQVSIVTRQLVR